MKHARTRWALALWVPLSFAATGLRLTAQEAGSGAPQGEGADYGQVVEDFIQYDIGNIRDAASVRRIKSRFAGLKSAEAVPALVAGLNRSVRMRASCPITALAGKLRGIVGASTDPEVGLHVLRNLEERDAGGYTQHIRSVMDTAEKQVLRTKGKEYASLQLKRRSQEDQQRLAHVPGMKLTDLAVREPLPAEDSKPAGRGTPRDARPAGPRGKAGRPGREEVRGLTIGELAEQLGERPTQAAALEELHRRASSGDPDRVAALADPIAEALKSPDAAARESAARLLGLLRVTRAVPRLIDVLEDPNAAVRSAASTALARTTRQLFGPRDDATADEIREAAAQWRDWWGRQTPGGSRP